MATARFWWYPGGEGHVEQLEIPEAVGVSDLQFTPAQLTGQAGGLSGARYTALISGYDEIVLSFANFNDEPFRRRLEALQRHLQAGFMCSFALDYDKAWAGFAVASPAQDDTAIVTTGNAWSYNGSATMANGDEVIIAHPPPATFKAEPHLVASMTGTTTLGLQTDLVFNYTDDPILVRHRDFYPILVSMGSSLQPLVTSERRRAYSFTARLRLSWEAIAAYYDASGGGEGSELDVLTIGNGRGPGATLDEASRYQPWRTASGAPWGSKR